MMQPEIYREIQNIDELMQMDVFYNLDEFDLRNLCELMKDKQRTIHSCISKGQLKTLCNQLMAENLALKKRLSKENK